MFGNRISRWIKGVLKAPDVIASLSFNTTLLVWGTYGMTLQDQLQRLQQPCSDILRFCHWCWPIVGNFGKEKILTTNKTFKRSWGLSTGHIPQVKSTIHFSINKLLNHKDSPRSRRAFCKKIGTRRHFWCCLFICVMVTSCTLLTMTCGKWLVFQTHQNTSYNLRDSQNKLKVWFPHTNYFKTV